MTHRYRPCDRRNALRSHPWYRPRTITTCVIFSYKCVEDRLRDISIPKDWPDTCTLWYILRKQIYTAPRGDAVQVTLSPTSVARYPLKIHWHIAAKVLPRPEGAFSITQHFSDLILSISCSYDCSILIQYFTRSADVCHISGIAGSHREQIITHSLL